MNRFPLRASVICAQSHSNRRWIAFRNGRISIYIHRNRKERKNNCPTFRAMPKSMNKFLLFSLLSWWNIHRFFDNWPTNEPRRPIYHRMSPSIRYNHKIRNKSINYVIYNVSSCTFTRFYWIKWTNKYRTICIW